MIKKIVFTASLFYSAFVVAVPVPTPVYCPQAIQCDNNNFCSQVNGVPGNFIWDVADSNMPLRTTAGQYNFTGAKISIISAPSFVYQARCYYANDVGIGFVFENALGVNYVPDSYNNTAYGKWQSGAPDYFACTSNDPNDCTMVLLQN